MTAQENWKKMTKARTPVGGSPQGAGLLAGHASYDKGILFDGNPFDWSNEPKLATDWSRGWVLRQKSNRRLATTVSAEGMEKKQ